MNEIHSQDDWSESKAPRKISFFDSINPQHEDGLKYGQSLLSGDTLRIPVIKNGELVDSMTFSVRSLGQIDPEGRSYGVTVVSDAGEEAIISADLVHVDEHTEALVAKRLMGFDANDESVINPQEGEA